MRRIEKPRPRLELPGGPGSPKVELHTPNGRQERRGDEGHDLGGEDDRDGCDLGADGDHENHDGDNGHHTGEIDHHDSDGPHHDNLRQHVVNDAGGDDTACISQLQGPPPDIYRTLVKGTGEQRGAAALAVLQHRSRHARAVVQRAILAVAAEPFCAQLRPLTCTLADKTMDDETRGAAALALGVIARDFPCTFPSGACPLPHDPIPQWSQKALNDCLRLSPAMVARSCAEALGYVSTADRATLSAIRDDTSNDSLLRLFAG